MFLNTVLSVYVPARTFVAHQVKQFAKRTEGASAIEYALIVAMVAMVAIVIIAVSPDIQSSVKTMFNDIKTGLDTRPA